MAFESLEFLIDAASRNAICLQNPNQTAMRLIVGFIYLASGRSPMFLTETQKPLMTKCSSE